MEVGVGRAIYTSKPLEDQVELMSTKNILSLGIRGESSSFSSLSDCTIHSLGRDSVLNKNCRMNKNVQKHSLPVSQQHVFVMCVFLNKSKPVNGINANHTLVVIVFYV